MPLDYTVPSEWFGYPNRPRCYLLEVDAYRVDVSGSGDGAFGNDPYADIAFAGAVAPSADEGATTLRFSTHPHITPSGDTPASTEYDPRLSAIRVDTRIAGASLAGFFEVFAEADVANGDGGLDTLLSLYAFGGRDCTIRLGEPGWYLDSGSTPYFSVVYVGRVQSVEITSGVLRFRFASRYGVIAQPLAVPVYAGTGGLEGGDDLKGKVKPAVFGLNRNVSLTLVDPSALIYQFHFGPVNVISNILSLFDRGIPLTEVFGVAPSTGQFTVQHTQGTVTLGATPSGEVTADLYGHYPGTGGYTWKNIIEYLFGIQGLDPATVIDSASMTAYDPNLTAGVSLGTEHQHLRDLLDYLLRGARLFGGFDRAGKFLIGRVTPAGTPAYSFDTNNILALERQTLPADLEPIVSRVQFNYKRNWTPQGDLAAGVSAAQRSFAAQEWRSVTRWNDGIDSQYRNAQTLEVNTPWVQEADAVLEINREFPLWSTRRNFYRVLTNLAGAYQDAATGAKIDIGSIVSLTYDRFGLSSTTGTVVSWALNSTADGGQGAVELGVIV